MSERQHREGPALDVAAETAESLTRRAVQLEQDLRAANRFGLKATRQLHRALMRDLKAAEERAALAEERAALAERGAVRAEKATAAAERRTKRAGAEVEKMRESTTWRVGRVVVAVPSKIKRMGRS